MSSLKPFTSLSRSQKRRRIISFLRKRRTVSNSNKNADHFPFFKQKQFCYSNPKTLNFEINRDHVDESWFDVDEDSSVPSKQNRYVINRKRVFSLESPAKEKTCSQINNLSPEEIVGNVLVNWSNECSDMPIKYFTKLLKNFLHFYPSMPRTYAEAVVDMAAGNCSRSYAETGSSAKLSKHNDNKQSQADLMDLPTNTSSDGGESYAEIYVKEEPFCAVTTTESHPNKTSTEDFPHVSKLENKIEEVIVDVNALHFKVDHLRNLCENNQRLMHQLLMKFGDTLPETTELVSERPKPASTQEELEELLNCPNIVQYLVTCKDATLTRTVSNMLRMLLTRNLAIQYSFTGLGMRKKATKLQFRGSRACLIIESALFQMPEYRDLPRQEIQQAVSRGLRNSIDWDGFRSLRRKTNEDEEDCVGWNGSAVPLPIPIPVPMASE